MYHQSSAMGVSCTFPQSRYTDCLFSLPNMQQNIYERPFPILVNAIDKLCVYGSMYFEVFKFFNAKIFHKNL